MDKFTRYVILLNRIQGKEMPRELVKAHVEHLKGLESTGKLVLCGPFTDYAGGMAIINADNIDEAKQIAEQDPFVKEKASNYEIRTLQLSCSENNHMGMGSALKNENFSHP
ncbi:MAG: YciI family protein [Armatimonadota bacterium]